MVPTVVVAHPDDEIALFGIALQRSPGARLIHTTDGAPRDGRDAARHGLTVAEYREARRRELSEALELLGTPVEAECLAHPDGALLEHAGQLVVQLRERLVGAAEIWTHAWEGGHPDHDVTACCVHRAAPPGARVYEGAGYHAGPGGVVVGEFIRSPGGEAGGITEMVPSPAELARKQAMLARFATQAETLAAFCRPSIERRRLAARPSLGRPPHDGPLLYEQMGWATFAEVQRRLGSA
jgi:LmbE family N-acetylglucosaminyl deacetylase